MKASLLMILVFSILLNGNVFAGEQHRYELDHSSCFSRLRKKKNTSQNRHFDHSVTAQVLLIGSMAVLSAPILLPLAGGYGTAAVISGSHYEKRQKQFTKVRELVLNLPEEGEEPAGDETQFAQFVFNGFIKGTFCPGKKRVWSLRKIEKKFKASAK